MEFENLNKINTPKDLEKIKDLNKLCEEIRGKLIDTISKNGGHLASNLGAVELTVALHKVFNSQDDAIVWDVGHQSYTHKILTGRFNSIDTIRKEGGLSGFTNRFESDYDKFISGHSSTSISAALGLAEAKGISGNKGNVVAVIGDGALTGGLAYEGLNNAGRFKKNFIVVINDNKMSISRNVGSMARYLTCMRIRPSYMRLKSTIERTLNKVPLIGGQLKNVARRSKYAIKGFLANNTLFESMGFNYYGPIDGHDVNELIRVFNIVKNIDHPIVVHVLTSKGKGYKFAEKNPKKFHGISAFDVQTGLTAKTQGSFSNEFGKSMCELAETNKKICAITAAMTSGTGLTEFAEKYKERFFDVGIAEEHAITFAGGLAAGGMLPVFAVYSSFLQRGYDQIIHDAALQKLRMVFAIDRCGLIGEDGETHQGIFDVSFLNSIPNVTIYCPSFFDELDSMLFDAIYKCKNVAVVRYPRGGQPLKPLSYKYNGGTFDLYGDKDADTLIVTYGRLFSYACQARLKLVKQDKKVCVMKLNVIKPLDREAVLFASSYKKIFFFEETIRAGGVGERFGCNLAEYGFSGRYVLNAIDNTFVKHASVESQLKKFSFDTEGIVNKILMECYND